ncbi:MAG: 50S ribosomal protein L21 [Planctomycetota bacterium]
MYAVIEDSGTQIKVAEGDTIKVADRELSDDAISLTFDRVLMIGGGDGESSIGAPVVSGASVEGDILSEEAGEKVRVVKYKRRKNYRRVKGHKQPYLLVKVTKINAA